MIEGAVVADEAFVLRWFDPADDDRLMVINLGRDIDFQAIAEPLIAPPPKLQWDVLWSSEAPDYGGAGTPEFDDKNGHFPGHTAVVFHAQKR